MGIYESPKATKNNYYVTLGDMNLNKLRPGDKKEKILECLIKEPTGITETSSTSTPVDAIPTNKQNLRLLGSTAKIRSRTLSYLLLT